MPAKEKTKDRYTVPAVEQAGRVLFCLAGSESLYMNLPEICNRLGIHKSKAFSILETLQKFGLVRKNSDGKGYALGTGLVTLSRKVLDDLSPPRIAEPMLKELAMKAGCTAVLGLISQEKIFIAAKQESEANFGVTVRIGHRLPLTYGAHGKAIAAFLPEDQLDRLLERQDLYFHGEPAVLDRVRLRKELAQCRRDGFAEDLGELNHGLNVITSPVLGPAGVPIGIIQIFVLFSAEGAHQLGPLVAKAGKELSRQLGANITRYPTIANLEEHT